MHKDFNKFREAWFRGVYHKHFPELYFYLRSFTVDEELINDIIQDAFVSLLEKDRFEKVANIRNYLFSCVRNSLFDKIKSEKKKERLKIEMSRDAQGTTNDNTKESFERMISLTEEAIRNLPPVCKAIFTMAKINGLTYRQIAERMNLSVKTVEAQMGIAFKKIREYLSIASIESVK